MSESSEALEAAERVMEYLRHVMLPAEWEGGENYDVGDADDVPLWSDDLRTLAAGFVRPEDVAEAQARAAQVFGWQHLVKYAGMSAEWMDATLSAVVAAALRPVDAPEHSHETGGAWHVTRWQAPGCPACAVDAPEGGAPECDHPGIEHGSLSYVGVCPGCRKCKFIGHGPLCGDCYEARGAL